MGLKFKFNLVMLAAFLVGLGLSASAAYTILQRNARAEIVSDAWTLMKAAGAIRHYTASEIAPLLTDQEKLRFLPQSVPSYAAQTNFRALQKSLPEFAYHEPALNPTNPTDRALDWEADIINSFRRTDGMAQLVTERDTPSGPLLSIALPIRAGEKECLVCHSTPAAAPASMIDLYGRDNGFGWHLGEVVAAQVISVPERVALDKANQTFILVLGALLLVFVLMIVLMNLLLHFIIIRPVRRIAGIASEISLGNMAAADFAVKGKDEISQLGEAFNRMRRSLANAMRLLEDAR